MIVKPKIWLATFKDLAAIVKIYNQAINSKRAILLLTINCFGQNGYRI